ncbi:MAG: dihydrolipoyl dehydrogenase [Sphaerochaetaceae bacterium]
MDKFDLIVVGAGPGGYIAAQRAGEMGKRVLLVEKDQLGGVCTNRGCIPTKSLLNSAKQYVHAKEAGKFGVHCEGVSFSMEEAMAWKQQTIETLRSGIQFLMKSAGVTVVSGTAEFIDSHNVRVGDQTFTGDFLILATGSSPAVPPIEGHDKPNVVTSDEILELKKAPKSLVVIGGGVIGVEFASFFSMLGTDVTVVEMMSEILPMMDGEFAKLMRRELAPVKFSLGCKVTRITDRGIEFLDGKGEKQSAEAELVLMSVGRRPDSQGLEPLGLEMDRAAVKVDDTMRTSVPNVYAIGDLNGRSQLAHSAERMAEVAVDNIFGSRKQVMRYNAVPWAVYSNPEAAGCGLTETAAAKAGIAVRCATTQMRANGRFLAENGKKAAGLVKVVSDAATGVVLGVHMMGPYSSEMIWGASALIENEMRLCDVKELIFPHPSVSELVRDTVWAIRQR